ncbi:MAG: hypothetical protein NVS9B15_07430 [Acidobacteriaceae bacterium]
MIIYFLRHASAGEKRSTSKKDDQRALDADGIQQCYQLSRLFSRLDVVPDLIITSPLKRALQTAAMVANELGYDDKLRIEKSLKPETKWEDFRPMLRSYGNETVIVVGHSPNLSQFVGRIISDAGHRAEIDIRKGGVARVDFDGRRGELQLLLTPKLIREANAGVEIGPAPKQPPEITKVKTGHGKVAKLLHPGEELPKKSGRAKSKRKKKVQPSISKSRPKTASR